MAVGDGVPGEPAGSTAVTSVGEDRCAGLVPFGHTLVTRVGVDGGDVAPSAGLSA